MILNYNNTQIDLAISDESYRNRQIMGENSITLIFSLPEYIDIPVGAFAQYQGETYTLLTPQNFIKNNSRNFEYTLVLESAKGTLAKYKFHDIASRRLKFTLTAKPHEFIQMLVNNLNQRETGWTVGAGCIDAAEKYINFSFNSCAEALQTIADAFETEWEIQGKTIYLKKIEYNKEAPLALSYGKGNGFKSGVKRENNNGSERCIEILYVQGGTRNIDPSKYGGSELRLPISQQYTYEGKTYTTDADGFSIRRAYKALQTNEEGSLDCSEIYPSREGTISSVVAVDIAKNFYDIIDTSIPSNLDYVDKLIAGETMTVIFQDGMLAGREFEVKYYHDAIGSKAARRFEIVPQEIDGQTMPNETFKPVAGNKYVVFHVELPDTYVCDNTNKIGASWDMFIKGVKYLSENENPHFSFNGTLDGIWTKNDWLNIGGKIKLGGFVLFTDDQFETEGVKIRITGIKDYINKPHSPEIELSNATSGTNISTYIGKIEKTEVLVEDKKDEAIRYTKRQYRSAKETMEMIQSALTNYSGAINPITVQTMQALVGDESLQFRFVNSKTTPTEIDHIIAWNGTTKKLTSAAGIIQHMTLGISSIGANREASEYLYWDMASFESPVLTDAAKKYYLYAKVSKTTQAGVFHLSETAISIESITGYYMLLMAIVNTEYETEREISTLYGYTEILPGRITTNKIVSPSGNTYFDLLNDEIGGNIKFRSTSGALKTVETAIGEIEVGGANLILQSNTPVSTADYYLRSCITSENIITGEEYTLSIKGDVGRTYDIWVNWGENHIGATTYKGGGLSVITFVAPAFESGLEKLINVYRMSDADTSVATIQWVQLEKGNKATDWKPAFEDVAADATSKANAAQAAAQAYALAKAELAETTAKAHADGIVDAEEARAIADATAKAEAARVAAVNTAAADATAKVNNIQIGGANLIRNSWLNFETSEYLLFLADLTEDFIAGKQYTFSVYSFFDAVQIWVDDGNVLIGNTTHKVGGLSEITFTAPAITTPTEKRRLYIYKTAPSDVVGGMFWVQLEKGNKATDWKPSFEDVAASALNSALEYGTGKNLFPQAEFANGLDDWNYGYSFLPLNVSTKGVNLSPDWSLDGNTNLRNNQGLNTIFMTHGNWVDEDPDVEEDPDAEEDPDVYKNSHYAYLESQSIKCIQGGRKYIISAYVANHRAIGVLMYIEFYNSNGSWLNYSGIQETAICRANEASGGKNINGYKRIYAVVTAHQDAVSANIVIRKYGTAKGYSDSYMFVCRPMLEQVAVQTTKPGVWTPYASGAEVAESKALLADIASDKRLTPNEKQQVSREWTAIQKEVTSINSQSAALGIDDTDYDSYADFLNYYFALDAYLNTSIISPNTVPLLSAMSETSVVVAAQFNTHFANCYSGMATQKLAIAGAINSKAAEAKATADAQAYLKAAIAQVTEVNGGLVLAAALCARDVNGAVTAYLNGLTQKPYAVAAGVKNWGTGTESARSWIDFIGNAKFGNLRIGTNGDGTTWIEDANGITRTEFSIKNIPTLASLLAASGQDTTVNNIAQSCYATTIYTAPNSITVQNDNSELTITGSITASANIDVPTHLAGMSIEVLLIKSDNSTYASISYLRSDTDEDMYDTQNATFNVKLTGVPAGNYRLMVETVAFTSGSGTAYAYISPTTMRAQYALDSRAMLFGADGLSLFWDAYKYFHIKQGAVTYRGAWDVPAGLGGASINSGGGISNRWGLAGTTSSRSTNTTTIKHNVTDTKFTVDLTPRSSFTWYLLSTTAASSPTNNDGNIVIVCSSTTAVFDFTIKRTPY